jgi:hypothetical protein
MSVTECAIGMVRQKSAVIKFPYNLKHKTAPTAIGAVDKNSG